MLKKLLESPLNSKEVQPVHLKEISPEYSLEGLMLKLKLQNFGHLMQRADSLEKALMLGMTEGRRRGSALGSGRSGPRGGVVGIEQDFSHTEWCFGFAALSEPHSQFKGQLRIYTVLLWSLPHLGASGNLKVRERGSALVHGIFHTRVLE